MPYLNLTGRFQKVAGFCLAILRSAVIEELKRDSQGLSPSSILQAIALGIESARGSKTIDRDRFYGQQSR